MPGEDGNSHSELTDKISDLLDRKFDAFKRQLNEENELFVKKVKKTDSFKFSKKGTEEQYKFNQQILDKVE